MKKIILLISFIILLFSNENIISAKNIAILNSFDIPVEFLKDKKLNKMYKYYTNKKKEYFLNILENGYTYIPLIKNKIREANIPPDIIFVAMAESYFTTKASSNRSANGLWQFIPATARHFNLKIDDYVDERKDPIKSTIAAISYFSYLHSKLGKWYLAMMAYNCGEARIIEAITRAKIDLYCENKKCHKDKNIIKMRKIITKYQHRKVLFSTFYRVYKQANILWEKDVTLFDLMKEQKNLSRQYLPKETRNYIRKISAMSFLLNADEFVQYTNHYLLNRGSASSIVKVKVPAGTNLNYVSKLLKISPSLLKSFNRQLKYDFTPPLNNYFIYIPYQKLAFFKENFSAKTSKNEYLIYYVKRGDSIGGIANKFHINYRVIKNFNHLKTNLIKPRQKLIIPILKSKVSKNIIYYVKRGESLKRIANKFHISYKDIIKINHLKSTILRVKQKLIIPISSRTPKIRFN